jgi:hypothetical protein
MKRRDETRCEEEMRWEVMRGDERRERKCQV